MIYFLHMEALAFLLFVCAVALLGIAATIIVYHLLNLHLAQEHHRLMVAALVIGFGALAFLEFEVLSWVDWEAIKDIIRNRAQL